MTRLGYFLFNLLLILAIYGLVYLGGSDPRTLTYTIRFFSAPLIAVNFVMAIYALLHWFMSQNHDVSREGITFLHATWVIALMTFIAYLVISHTSITHMISSLK